MFSFTQPSPSLSFFYSLSSSSVGMSTSDEQLKKAADLKLWIESRIGELQEEIEKLKEAQAFVDNMLRASSFRPASEVVAPPLPQAARGKETYRPVPAGRCAEGGQIPEIRELRRDRGGETIAVAQMTRDSVVVEPVAEVTLKAETPPFRSFLVGKILTGMKAKDEELAAKGKLGKEKELSFTVNEKSGRISSLASTTTGRARGSPRCSTPSGWTFSRMLEKGSTSSR